MFISTVAKAYDFKDGNCYYSITSLSELTVSLTNSGERINLNDGDPQYEPCYSGDFIIPKTVEYSGRIFTVTSIDVYAFQNCNLEKLTVPTSILSGTIDGTVKKLIIEDSNAPISNRFIVINAKDVYVGRNIDHLYTFAYSGIEKIAFGDSVTYVSDYMLDSCSELVSVELSKSIRTIKCHAFYGCSKLTSISGQNVESINEGAFYGCISLEHFNFPNLITIEDSPSSTYWGVFQGCASLKSVNLPDGLTKIGSLAFMDCTSLEKVTIPGTISAIGHFYDDITLGCSFANCPKLNNISIASKTPIYIPESTFDSKTYLNATLRVPEESVETYKKAAIWKNFLHIEGDASLESSVCIVSVKVFDYYNGVVEFLDKTVDAYEPVLAKVSVGENLTVKIKPNNGYCIKRVSVNDKDFTSHIINNTLTVNNIQENLTIEVEFEEEPIYLTIKQADNGSTKLKVNKWEEYNFSFYPAEGWEIHSVSFNGEDVTDKLTQNNSYSIPKVEYNSELIVSYVAINNGICDVIGNSSSAKVIGSNSSIIVLDTLGGEPIDVYSASGTLVCSTTANLDKTIINVDNHNVYIVKVGNTTFKIGI